MLGPYNNNENNGINLQIQIFDLSNSENRLINIPRSSIIEELFTIDQSTNSNFLINLLQNNINNILQNNETLNNQENPFIENFINSTFDDDNKKKFKRVTHDNELEKLKIQKFDTNKKYANTECPINLNKFEKDDDIIILPCNHVYSSELIKKWLSEESNCCPICRYELEYQEIKCHENENNHNENNHYENNNHYFIPIYNNILNDEEDIILQQILLDSYSAERLAIQE